MRRSLAVICLTCILCACGGNKPEVIVTPGVVTPTIPLTGKIAFVSGQNGVFKIFVVNADGSHLRQLSDNAPRDDNPQWSPDGNQIAFESYYVGYDNMFLIHTHSTNPSSPTSNTASR